MTYDWNKQVEITVPTGTNGWIYSGEVIINGVKVRFPVGVPTTVPEPAAALLNKMIELEREEENNTAKPDNHYVGSVTIPEGKTLTLAKGAKVVDEDGLLGGSSTPAPVVILPETEALADGGEGEDGSSFAIFTPPSTTPTEGATAIVTYNGVEYASPILRAEDEGMAFYVMGNASLMGVAGGNPDAPFVVVLIPDGMEGLYGQVVATDGATSVTISIVEKEGASGDAAESPVVVVPFWVDNSLNIKITKSFDEILALANSGKVVFLTGVFAYSTWFMQLVAARDNGEGSQIVFASGDGKANTMSILYTRDGATLNS